MTGHPPIPTLFPYPTLFRSERGFHVLAMNPKQLARFRDRHTMSGAKDDRRDACVLADSVRTDQPSFRRLHLVWRDRKSTRLNSSHDQISYAVFCLKKKNYVIDHFGFGHIVFLQPILLRLS